MSLRAQRNRGPKWFEVYPLETLIEVDSKSETFLVDIGGGVGHHLIELKEHFAVVPEKLVLQDIGPVIDGIELPDGIEAMAHDFFKPQPIKKAEVYYLAHILHDWPARKQKPSLATFGMPWDRILFCWWEKLSCLNAMLHPRQLLQISLCLQHMPPWNGLRSSFGIHSRPLI
jgi:hypothetical protein